MNAAGVLIALAFAAEPLPPQLDLKRFPSLEVCKKELAKADDHLAYLAAASSLDCVYPEWWAARIEEAQAARGLWDDLRWAKTPNFGYQDRMRLDNIRTAIGPVAYRDGVMPPSVPESHANYR